MKSSLPSLIAIKGTDWDCLTFVDKFRQLRFKLFPAAEHVLYDKEGMPIDVLNFPSLPSLEQALAGYVRVSHKEADRARKLLEPRAGYWVSRPRILSGTSNIN